MRFYLDETEANEKTKQSFKLRFEEEVERFKKNGVDTIFTITPDIFHETIGFDDWASAMTYLQQHREEAFNFWRTNE